MNRKIFFIIFAVFGLALFGFGIYMTFFELNGYKETKAVIDHVDEIYIGMDEDGGSEYEYNVFVRYSVDGKEYYNESDFYAAGYEAGKEIKIYYNPDDPSQIHGNSQGFGIYLLILGPVVAAVSVFIFVKESKKGSQPDAA